MELTGSGEPTVEELRRLVAMQGELVQSHAARVTALDAALEAALGPPTLRADDPETGAQEGDELRRSGGVPQDGRRRPGGASIIGLASGEPAPAEAGPAGQAATGIVGDWVVSISYKSGPRRTRGLATFSAGGLCRVGVSL